MNAIVQAPAIRAMSLAQIDKVTRAQTFLATLPQQHIATRHTIHGGLYTRTITIPKGVVITGVLIKIPTTLIFNGHAHINTGETGVELRGYHILPASAGRKQVIIAHEDTDLTMVFPTDAKTVEEAEAQFTDEFDLLMSHNSSDDTITITGE